MQVLFSAQAHFVICDWTIELAFCVLKEHLGLHHWWSAHPVLRQQQALLFLIIAAQLLQALRLLIEAYTGRDPFEVSRPLLVQYLPQLLHQHEHPVVWVLTHATTLGLFRPSSRYHTRAPLIPPTALALPPLDLPLTRKACYRTYPDRPKRTPRSARQPRTPPAHSSAPFLSSASP